MKIVLLRAAELEHRLVGWGSGSGAVDLEVALLERGDGLALAFLTSANPSHYCGKRTLEGVGRRLLSGLP